MLFAVAGSVFVDMWLGFVIWLYVVGMDSNSKESGSMLVEFENGVVMLLWFDSVVLVICCFENFLSYRVFVLGVLEVLVETFNCW